MTENPICFGDLASVGWMPCDCSPGCEAMMAKCVSGRVMILPHNLSLGQFTLIIRAGREERALPFHSFSEVYTAAVDEVERLGGMVTGYKVVREILEVELDDPAKEMNELSRSMVARGKELGFTALVLLCEPIDSAGKSDQSLQYTLGDTRHLKALNFTYGQFMKMVAQDMKGGADVH